MKLKPKEKIVNIKIPEIKIPRASWRADKEMLLDELMEQLREYVTAKMEGTDTEFMQ